MIMHPVKSTNVRSVGYDGARRTLRILFQNGALYEYAGVAFEVYDALLDAPSKGRFVHDHVKDRYPHRKVDPEAEKDEPVACMDAMCPRCRKRFGWRGRVVDRPPCPGCGHQIAREILERDQAEIDRFFAELDAENRKAADR